MKMMLQLVMKISPKMNGIGYEFLKSPKGIPIEINAGIFSSFL